MNIYLVGGALRDRLLGLEVKDRDFVVTGVTPDELLKLGYKRVGRDFPVFLHPVSGEEYALARTERKHGSGHTGFVTRYDQAVTLEDDLARRDLTINAIAEDEHGRLIDPYGGLADLESRVLRHVTPAFSEDPLRVLRVARFAARFANLGFTVAPETLALMSTIAACGELHTLTAERVMQELLAALMTARPSVFFQVLRECGALTVLLPEVDALFGVPQRALHHPEIDTGRHVMIALDLAAREKASLAVRYAVLLHDLGKALTPKSEWPAHIGHERTGMPLVEAVSERWRAPRALGDLARLTCRWHLILHQGPRLRPTSLLKVFDACDAWRRPQRFAELLAAAEYDARGRQGREPAPYPQRAFWLKALATAAAVKPEPAETGDASGAEIGARLRRMRTAALAAWKRDLAHPEPDPGPRPAPPP